eukprot:scaffold625_cov420-Prasinococcus_capsulatus_cf.AAC.17
MAHHMKPDPAFTIRTQHMATNAALFILPDTHLCTSQRLRCRDSHGSTRQLASSWQPCPYDSWRA